jgi:hypothetical protein
MIKSAKSECITSPIPPRQEAMGDEAVATASAPPISRSSIISSDGAQLLSPPAVAEAMRAIVQLEKEGILTHEEFQAKKVVLLARL